MTVHCIDLIMYLCNDSLTILHSNKLFLNFIVLDHLNVWRSFTDSSFQSLHTLDVFFLITLILIRDIKKEKLKYFQVVALNDSFKLQGRKN